MPHDPSALTAGVLGANWDSLDFDPADGVARNFEAVVVEPVIHEPPCCKRRPASKPRTAAA